MTASESDSVKREFERETISLENLFQKFQKKDMDYKIYLVRENQYRENEVFEIVGILGSGRSCFVFLALVDKKLVSLRMSYEQADFKDKFDSVRVEMEDQYDEYFLNILYPSVPIDYLCVGSIVKKNKLFFDRKVYASFWEKADATLLTKRNAPIDKKIRWFTEFLEGLQIIHSRKRAHFDIKLDNLFLVGGRLKIGDFEYYLKIEDFVNSNIHYCGTPGHMAPEIFSDKRNISERIDIFSAGVTFARLFCGVPYPGETVPDQPVSLSPEEEHAFHALFKPEILDAFQVPIVRHSFLNNFKIFNFYRNTIRQELERADLVDDLAKIYPILLEMMTVDPLHRPDVQGVHRMINTALGRIGVEVKSDDQLIRFPVFRLHRTSLVVVNLNKKTAIEIGNIKRKDNKDNPTDPSGNDVNLRFVDISRRHLSLHFVEVENGEEDDDRFERIEVRDLQSKHGVSINDQRIDPTQPAPLKHGDILQLGNLLSFKFTDEVGYYMLKHITHEKKGGNLLWLDKNQLNEIPDRQAAIIFTKNSLPLSALGVEENAALHRVENGNFEFTGNPSNAPVSGDIIL
ncbi:MAG: protein kinase domain-containing protein [Candidatus Omnitrophota bacterium]